MFFVFGKRNFYLSFIKIIKRETSMIFLEENTSNTLVGDQDMISAFVKKSIGNHNIEILSDPVGDARLRYNDLAGFSTANLSYGGRLKVFCDDLNDIYHFQVIVKGNCIWRRDDGNLKLFPGDAVMLNPHEKLVHEYSDDCEKFILKIPESFIKEVFISKFKTIPKSGLEFNRRSISLRNNVSFVKLLEAISSDSLSQNDDYPIDGLYKEIILNKILSVFLHNGEMRLSYPGERDFEHMLNFIDENIKSNIGAVALSEYSGKSVRTIYNLFSSLLSTTPKSYVKNLKLQGIKEGFMQGKYRNVTEAAYEYGFTHLGRFAAEYKNVFGETPSQTLKNR